MRQVEFIDPESPSSGTSIGWPILASGDAFRALTIFNSVLDGAPNDVLTQLFKYDVLVTLGSFAEALEVMGRRRNGC